MNNANKRLAFAGCKDTTFECMSALIRLGYQIDLLISIDPENARKNKVAGYMDLSEFALANNIKLYTCQSYSLQSDADKNNLREFKIDVLLVIGWQRLIPEWLLLQLKVGAFGMHGSSRALPYGRGRSPMNWSLLQGKDKFMTNLFKYKPGIDDGDILATQIFDINIFDTARSCHYKNTLSMIQILKDNLDRMLENNIKLRPQLDTPPTFYPKRSKKDGVIFWERETTEIYNLIRAVTRPFPGAISYLDKTEIIIWEARPFDTRLFDPEIPAGTILQIFINGEFVIKTGSDTMLVLDYEIPNGIKLSTGQKLHSASHIYKSHDHLPAPE